MEIICGLYKPAAGEDKISLSSAAALHADLVILDWYLEGHNSSAAKEIVRTILRKDLEQNGRLRLIAVYTAQRDLQALARELLVKLNDDDSLHDRLVLASDGKALVGPDTRVCFINKPTIGATADDIVEEQALPERLISEFALITQGVLATFAVNSVAAIRRAAHHLVSVFRKELDGAYVGHRCALLTPDDAKEFAVEFVTGELRNIISMDGIGETCMNLTILESWIDHITEAGHQFTDHADAQASSDLVKRFLKEGAVTVEKSKDDQRRKGTDERLAKNMAAIKPETVGSIFFKSADDAWRRMMEFSRLTSFKREAFGRTRFPENWRPTLTLGTVLKVVRTGNQEVNDDLPADYLVCMQPRCDSLRLDSETSFPFQTACVAQSKFNLVVKDWDDEGTLLLVSSKPRDVVMVRFKPSDSSRVIEAAKDEEDRFSFIDVWGRKFRWIGDLKDLKAQRDASALAAQVHSVGIDEFEWLRRAAGGAIKRL